MSQENRFLNMKNHGLRKFIPHVKNKTKTDFYCTCNLVTLSHFVRVDKIGIDKMGIDEVGIILM